MSLTLSQAPSPFSFSFSGNPIIVEVDNDMDHILSNGQPIVNYKIGLRLYRNGSHIKTLLHEVDSSGKARFNLAPYLQGDPLEIPSIDSIFDLPPNIVVQYSFEYFSQGWSNSITIEQDNTQDFFAVNGGLPSYAQLPGLDHWVQNKQFLTRAPQRYLKEGQKDILYFILPSGEMMTLRITGKLKDGTDVDFSYAPYLFSYRKVYSLAVHIAITYAINDQPFEYLDLWFDDEYGDPLTEVKRYYSDPIPVDQSMPFLFLNSLGVWECFYSYGAYEQAIATESKEALFDNYSEYWQRRWHESYSCSIDFKRPEEVQHLKDMLRSKRCYAQLHGRWVPIRFPDARTILKRSDRYDHIIKLKFETVHQNEFYSL
jgi:hypothetical protein